VNHTGLKNPQAGSPVEVLWAFLRLGLTSFGGPIAHLGYLRRELVQRRRWLSEHAFADLIALCQFLPGPLSSQVAFAIGLGRAGCPGAVAAWCGFTLPSALLMTAFAYTADALSVARGGGALHGLQLVAVAIVAQAVIGMTRTLCPDFVRILIALLTFGLSLAVRSAWAQLAVIAVGTLLGTLLCRGAAGASAAPASLPVPVTRASGIAALTLFAALLLGLPMLRHLFPAQALALFAACYHSGALVFGGGHVVLPLLRAGFVPAGWVSDAQFLSGYGAAQALPGPMFTFAAYLGAIERSAPHGVRGAALALFGIFLPGILILVGVLPFWAALRRRLELRAAILGANAAVVGLLAAALYDPVWVSAVHSPADSGLALAALLLLSLAHMPPWAVVLLWALGGAAASAL
jgi:chromate transporter